MNNSNFIAGVLFYLLGGTLAWFQNNLWQIFPWWKDRPGMTIALFCFPVGTLMFFSWQKFVLHFDNTWSARMMFFCLSYITFPFLTYYFLNESMFTLKNISCILLSFIIMYIQIKF